MVSLHYSRPDSQFDTETRLKWPVIILRTYQKGFDTNLTLRPLIVHIISRFIATASARCWKTIRMCQMDSHIKTCPHTPIGSRNIDTKSTKHKHKQAVNMNSSFRVFT